jgi:hypothetical protein
MTPHKSPQKARFRTDGTPSGGVGRSEYGALATMPMLQEANRQLMENGSREHTGKGGAYVPLPASFESGQCPDDTPLDVSAHL